MKSRVTAYLACPFLEHEAGPNKFQLQRDPELDVSESYVIALNPADYVIDLRRKIVERSPRATEIKLIEELFGLDMRLSRIDGPSIDCNEVAIDVLQTNDCVYVVPLWDRRKQLPDTIRAPEVLKTNLLRDMLELDKDNFRWIMGALMKRRGSEILTDNGSILASCTRADGVFSACAGPGIKYQQQAEKTDKHLEINIPEVVKSYQLSFDMPQAGTSKAEKQIKCEQKLEAEDQDSEYGLREAEADIKRNEAYAHHELDTLNKMIGSRSMHLQGPPGDLLPTVQFEQAYFYVVEGQEQVELNVLRTGNLDIEVSTEYRTVDASAVAGSKYKGAHGLLKFPPGVREHKINVDIIENDNFDVLLEFVVVLEKAVGCRLSQHHRRARVKIIDDDFFPSNRMREPVANGKMRDVSIRLFWEYFKFAFSDPVIRRGSIKAFLVDVYENLRFLGTLIIKVFLLDYVFAKSTPAGLAPNLLLLVVAASALLFLGSHMLEYRKCFWKIGGTARKVLLKNMMRKFLNYGAKGRHLIGDTDIMLMLVRDIPRTVGSGYMQVLILFQHALKIVALLFYQVVMPHVYIAFGLEKQITMRGVIMSLAPLFIYPVLLALFLAKRNSKVEETLYAEEEAESDLISFCDEVAQKNRLLADYGLRAATIDRWEAAVNKWNKAIVNTHALHVNNKRFSPWITEIIVAVWIIVGGALVKDSQASEGLSGVSIGDFLVTWDVFKSAGGAWASMYAVILLMQDVVPSLENIVMLMNIATETKDAQATADNQSRLLNDFIGGILERHSISKPSYVEDYANELPFRFHNFKYLHVSKGKISGGLDIDCEVPQGGLYLVVGGRGAGKSTFLKVLGRVILVSKAKPGQYEARVYDVIDAIKHPVHTGGQSMVLGTREDKGDAAGDSLDAANDDEEKFDTDVTSGEYFIPPHLRVLHISSKPEFFKGTLYDNLIMGVHPDNTHVDGSEEHVVNICRSLKLPESIVEHVKQRNINDWSGCLAESHQVLLSFARAFIANPEVLVLQKPFVYLNKTSTNTVISLLRHFVDDRGVGQDPKKFWTRRPRTCFMSGHVHDGCNMVDAIFEVHCGHSPVAINLDFKDRYGRHMLEDSNGVDTSTTNNTIDRSSNRSVGHRTASRSLAIESSGRSVSQSGKSSKAPSIDQL